MGVAAPAQVGAARVVGSIRPTQPMTGLSATIPNLCRTATGTVDRARRPENKTAGRVQGYSSPCRSATALETHTTLAAGRYDAQRCSQNRLGITCSSSAQQADSF
jgi:hypothetical protein